MGRQYHLKLRFVPMLFVLVVVAPFFSIRCYRWAVPPPLQVLWLGIATYAPALALSQGNTLPGLIQYSPKINYTLRAFMLATGRIYPNLPDNTTGIGAIKWFSKRRKAILIWSILFIIWSGIILERSTSSHCLVMRQFKKSGLSPFVATPAEYD